MLHRIKVPYFYRGIGENRNGFHKKAFRFFGGDTETVRGKPYSFQVSDGLTTDLIWVDEKTVTRKFLAYMYERVSSRLNIIFFHNLSFDMVCLFYPFIENFRGADSEVEIKDKTFRAKIYFGKRWFGKIWFPDGRQFWILDSWAFTFTSLSKIAKSLNLAEQKLAVPEGLGERKLKSRQFIEYAKQDAMVTYGIGRWIIDQHREFDVRMSVSLPQFASRVLRHHFIRPSEFIELPSEEICRPACLSYHGGKNGMYVKPGRYRDVTEADLTSAYAWAMTRIPQFVAGEYKRVNELKEPEYPGIYRISGEIKKCCKYPVIFTHEFKAVAGKFRDIWVTSYELFEALRTREISLDKARGILWYPEKYEHNPLKEYIETFFAKKDACAKDDPKRVIYKLLSNALYGKFIQHQKHNIRLEGYFDSKGKLIEETDNEYRAGGLYQPFIATLITGLVRARMHGLEVKYDAIHTATDSIKTFKKVEPEKGLGGLEIVCRGDCLIFRNKLYVHYDEAGKIAKYALHGYQGTVDELVKMWDEKRNTYKTRHMMKLKESFRRNKIPLVFDDEIRELNIQFA